MDWYQTLYDVEDRARLMSADERLALRQSEAKPIWEQMERWLEDVKLRTKNVVLPKSDFAKALQYVRNHFTEHDQSMLDELAELRDLGSMKLLP